MSVFLPGISAIRSVEWGSKHLWDVQFPTAPSPFNAWFPATSVRENVYSLERESWSLYMSSYSAVKSTGEFDLSITFVDDVKHTVLNWISHWVNTEILNGGQYVATLAESAKDVIVVRSDAEGNTVRSTTYQVIPDGSGYFEGDSSAEVNSGELALVVVGGGP